MAGQTSNYQITKLHLITKYLLFLSSCEYPPPQIRTPFVSSQWLYKPLLPSLNLDLIVLWDSHIYVIKSVFSPVNLPYVNLIIRSTKEPKLVEENVFLLKGSNTLTQISGFKFSLIFYL